MTTATLGNQLQFTELEQLYASGSTGPAFVDKVMRLGILSAQDEHELSTCVRTTKDPQVRAQAAWALVCYHLKLVVRMARDFQGYHLDQHDLRLEGTVGLCHAVERFDPDRLADGKRVRLASYAKSWIMAAMLSYVVRNFRIVKVVAARTHRQLFFRMRELLSRTGERLSPGERQQLAHKLGVKVADVSYMERALQPTVSYDGDGDDNAPAHRLVADEGRHAEIEVVEDDVDRVHRQALAAALATLSARERQVLEARHLSPDGKVKHKDIAARLGLTAARVCQIEKAAFAKVKRHMLAACPPARH